MYLSRPVLILLGFVYLLFLVSVDWINNINGTWYRPFLIGFLIVAVAIWAHHGQDLDEL